MKRFTTRPAEPKFAPDPWCTRSKIAGLWVDWRTEDGEPTPQEVRDVAAPDDAKRKQDAQTEAAAMLADAKKHDPILLVLRDLVARVDALERSCNCYLQFHQ